MKIDENPATWATEIHKDIVSLGFKIEKRLFSGRSKFQEVEVLKSHGLGAILFIDGAVMLSERDEFVYHEMITHVPLFVHPAPESILVIGGGDGGTIREAFKHRSVKKIVMVEIDEMVVQVCREYLPSVSFALDDPRLEILFEDGVKYVADTDERFDVVIIDSTDPVGPGAPLFEKGFYENVANILVPDGIMITQAGSPFYDHEIQQSMLENQRPFFNRLHIYLYSNLTYPGGLWSFGFASKGICPLIDFDPGRVHKSGISTRYYNAGLHFSSFMLPAFIKENLTDVLDPIELPFIQSAGSEEKNEKKRKRDY